MGKLLKFIDKYDGLYYIFELGLNFIYKFWRCLNYKELKFYVNVSRLKDYVLGDDIRD